LGLLRSSRLSHQKRKEQAKIEFKNWLERNKEKRLEYMKKWRLVHNYYINSYQRKWKFNKKLITQ